MRPLLLAGVVFCACTPSNPFVGSYNVMVTGMEMETAPQSSTRTIAGMGSLTVTENKDRNGYVIVFGENSYLCRLVATLASGAPNELAIADGQTCNISGFSGTTTMAKLSMDKDTFTTATLNISYSFTYQLFLVNHAGTGTRTYTGARL